MFNLINKKKNEIIFIILIMILFYSLKDDLTWLENMVEKFTKNENRLMLIHKRLLKNSLFFNFNKKIIEFPIKYINLNRGIIRQKFIEQQLKFIKPYINSLQRFEGIDCKLLEKRGMKWYKGYIKEKNIYYENISVKMEMSEVCTTLSHVICIKESYDEGLENVIICEDDISFSLIPYWKYSLNEILDKIKKIGKKWNVLRLAPLFCSRENKRITIKDFRDDWECYSAAAYLINREGMKNIIDSTFHNINGKLTIKLYEPNENEDQALADAWVFIKALNSVELISPILFYCVNNKTKLDSEIHPSFTDDHVLTNLETISRKLEKLCKKDSKSKYFKETICNLRLKNIK